MKSSKKQILRKKKLESFSHVSKKSQSEGGTEKLERNNRPLGS